MSGKKKAAPKPSAEAPSCKKDTRSPEVKARVTSLFPEIEALDASPVGGDAVGVEPTVEDGEADADDSMVGFNIFGE